MEGGRQTDRVRRVAPRGRLARRDYERSALSKICTVTLSTALLLATGCVSAPEPSAAEAGSAIFDEAELKAEISTEFAAYFDALNAGNYDAARQFYAADPRFFWVEDGILTYSSAEEAARSLEQMASSGAIHVDTAAPRIDVLGPDVATLYTTHTTTVGEGEGSFSFSGAMTITLVRTDGRWRFLSGHVSSPRPMGQ